MKKVALLCLFVVALSFFVGALLDFGYYCVFGPGLWHPTIVCENAVQNLGKLSSGDKPVPCKFTIKNTGSRPLVIEKARPGCGGCMEIVSFPKEPILPNKEGVIHASLLTKRLQKGSVTKTLAVFSNDPQHPALVLRVHADIEKTKGKSGETAPVVRKGTVAREKRVQNGSASGRPSSHLRRETAAHVKAE